ARQIGEQAPGPALTDGDVMAQIEGDIALELNPHRGVSDRAPQYAIVGRPAERALEGRVLDGERQRRRTVARGVVDRIRELARTANVDLHRALQANARAAVRILLRARIVDAVRDESGRAQAGGELRHGRRIRDDLAGACGVELAVRLVVIGNQLR